MAATSFFSVRGVERSPVWFAGFVLGQIKRSATGGDYPPPSFSEDNVPDDVPPDFLSALHYWYEDPRLAACVENGVVTTPLPPLKWLEMSKQVPPTSPTSVQSAADDEAGSGMEYDGDGSDGAATDDGHDAAEGENQSGNMRDVVMSCLLEILGDDAASSVSADTVEGGPAPPNTSVETEPSTSLGVRSEGPTDRPEARKPSVLLDQVDKIASRLENLPGQGPPNLKLTESLVRLWASMTPVLANLKESDLKGITKDHEYLKKYVLPADQRDKFRPPTLGPHTTQWLYQADPQVMKADTFMTLDADILHNVCLRILRWFDILEKKLKALQEDDTEATTVSVDAIDLLDDMSKAMELLGAQVRQLNSRRLRHIVQKLPKNPKCTKPLSLFVTDGTILGGSALESSAKAAVQMRSSSSGRQRGRQPFRNRGAARKTSARGGVSNNISAEMVSKLLQAFSQKSGSSFRGRSWTGSGGRGGRSRGRGRGKGYDKGAKADAE